MTREDIDRIATEYLNDTESEFEMQEVIELADRALILEQAIEDYKHEITKYIEDVCINECQAQGMMFCIDILDKHIGVKNEKTRQKQNFSKL